MVERSTTSLIFGSLILALFLNGFASTGPIITTYAGTLECNETDEMCKTNRRWMIGIGSVGIILALFMTTSSIYTYSCNPRYGYSSY